MATIYADITYGFTEGDSHDEFYAALAGENGSENTLVFRNMGSPWVLTGHNPISNLDDLTIIFEEGVILEAQDNSYFGPSDCLLRIDGSSNLTIIGYGATFLMHKEDFITGEHAMSLRISNASNLIVKGLTLDSSGGDGIYVIGWADCLIEDVLCTNHRRQGISIISATNLLIRHSKFLNTTGTAPTAGVDLEPNSPTDDLVNIVFEHCEFSGNDFSGITLALTYMNNTQPDVDITFTDCLLSNNNLNPPYSAGEITTGNSGNGNINAPIGGTVTFNRIAVDGSISRFYYQRKNANGYRTVFNNCVGINLLTNGTTNAAIVSEELAGTEQMDFGGTDLNDILIHYTVNQPWLRIQGDGSTNSSWKDFHGNITIVEPNTNAVVNANYNTANNVDIDYTFTNQTSLPTTFVSVNTIVNKAVKTTGQAGRFRISRSSARIDYPLFVKYSINSPEVNQGNDIHYLTGGAIIEANESYVDILIEPRDNGLTEPVRNITMTLEDRPLYSILIDTDVLQIEDIASNSIVITNQGFVNPKRSLRLLRL